MSTIEGLLRAYEQRLRQPWQTGLSGSERVWLAIYDPAQERRLRLRLQSFAAATVAAGHEWRHVELTDAFAEWLTAQPAREQYFAKPERMAMRLRDFQREAAGRIRPALEEAGEGAVVAVSGVASLFGLVKVSDVMSMVSDSIRGRLLIFFPGHREGNNYRLLDAHDGWDYLAVPIEAADGSHA
jgi:Domain of unknown function (DUF1788)